MKSEFCYLYQCIKRQRCGQGVPWIAPPRCEAKPYGTLNNRGLLRKTGKTGDSCGFKNKRKTDLAKMMLLWATSFKKN